MELLNIFNELSEHVSIQLNSCGEISHPENWIESKQHKDYDLWYIYSGEIQIDVQGKSYLAKKGDLVFFNPQIAYRASIISKSSHFLFTHFDFRLGNQTDILNNFTLAGIIPHELVPSEITYYQKAYKQSLQKKPMANIQLKSYLAIIIAKIIELYATGNYKGEFQPIDTTSNKKMNLPTLQPVFDYIEKHLHQSLRIADLAECVNMSEKYFIYYFKQAVGITPGKYMYQLKMNEARKLLYANLSIAEIAHLLGYPDQYSFSKAFKKYYKIPPSQFV